jgi:hypothetical protein
MRSHSAIGFFEYLATKGRKTFNTKGTKNAVRSIVAWMERSGIQDGGVGRGRGNVVRE